MRYGRKITKRFDSYEAALQVLTGLRYQEGAGTFDSRDYQVKSKPLAFSRLAEEWLAMKAGQLRPKSLSPLRMAVRRASKAWGEANIKSIRYAQVEDLLKSMDLAPKSKVEILGALKQLWAWAAARYEVPPLSSWPVLPRPEMRFRKTISVVDQEMILAEIWKLTQKTRPRAWLAIKWLATYIAIRPAEMLSLTEGQIDRQRGLLIIPHPKERKPKVVPLLEGDLELLRGFPEEHPAMPFFRHESQALNGMAGLPLGQKRLYRDWKEACRNLGIEGVDLYGGTKHSTAMGLREVATFEEVRKMTGHTTNKAFDRYLQLEGEKMKELYRRRQNLVDSDTPLIHQNKGVKEHKNKYLQ
jgi:integrase